MKAAGALMAGALLALAACAPSAEHKQAEPTSAASQSTASGPAVSSSAAAPGTTLPPAGGGAPRYVGRWATRADLCEGGAWVFTRDHFGIEDGPECHFDKVAEIPGGYHIAARCTAKGKQSRSDVMLRFAESAHAMLVEGLASLPDTGLIYCGES
ncbi:MAG: hypothetical protein ACTHK5_11785 [Tsuneonella sp.]